MALEDKWLMRKKLYGSSFIAGLLTYFLVGLLFQEAQDLLYRFGAPEGQWIIRYGNELVWYLFLIHLMVVPLTAAALAWTLRKRAPWVSAFSFFIAVFGLMSLIYMAGAWYAFRSSGG